MYTAESDSELLAGRQMSERKNIVTGVWEFENVARRYEYV